MPDNAERIEAGEVYGGRRVVDIRRVIQAVDVGADGEVEGVEEVQEQLYIKHQKADKFHSRTVTSTPEEFIRVYL